MPLFTLRYPYAIHWSYCTIFEPFIVSTVACWNQSPSDKSWIRSVSFFRLRETRWNRNNVGISLTPHISQSFWSAGLRGTRWSIGGARSILKTFTYSISSNDNTPLRFETFDLERRYCISPIFTKFESTSSLVLLHSTFTQSPYHNEFHSILNLVVFKKNYMLTY